VNTSQIMLVRVRAPTIVMVGSNFVDGLAGLLCLEAGLSIGTARLVGEGALCSGLRDIGSIGERGLTA